MADLFLKQAEQYAGSRPGYPSQLFLIIASKTPSHQLAWDGGTGSGQAAQPLAEIYKNVISTDASEKQFEYAVKLPNVRYEHTPSSMSMAELKRHRGRGDNAQALHWFGHPTFYRQVRWVLKKPHGVIAAWCYNVPRVTRAIDEVFDEYAVVLKPYWDPARALVDNDYRSIDFPFELVDGADETGLIEFVSEKEMDLDHFLMYLRSGSAYQTAKEKGVGLLSEDFLAFALTDYIRSEDVVERFESAWIEDGSPLKVAKFPVYLRIGEVGDA